MVSTLSRSKSFMVRIHSFVWQLISSQMLIATEVVFFIMIWENGKIIGYFTLNHI